MIVFEAILIIFFTHWLLSIPSRCLLVNLEGYNEAEFQIKFYDHKWVPKVYEVFSYLWFYAWFALFAFLLFLRLSIQHPGAWELEHELLLHIVVSFFPFMITGVAIGSGFFELFTNVSGIGMSIEWHIGGIFKTKFQPYIFLFDEKVRQAGILRLVLSGLIVFLFIVLQELW